MTGAAYSAQVAVNGGTAPYMFAPQAAVLPAGLSISTTGLITGTAASANPAFAGSLLVSDQTGATAQIPITIQVNAATPSTCSMAAAAQTPLIRVEGVTELLGELTFTCTGGGGSADLQVFLSPALNVTSKVLNTTTGATEALAITTAGSVQGIFTGTGLTFAGVTIPAGTSTVTITNVRVNATSLIVGTGAPPSISETVVLGGTGVVAGTLSQATVAFAFTGLGATKVSGVKNYSTCSPIVPSGGPAFTVKIAENFSTAFRTLAGEAGANESGA